jgi:hypothetical protein
MKKNIISSVAKSIVTLAILVLSLNVAHATETKPSKAGNYELTYVGTLSDQPVFQLDVENLQKEDMYIKLEDEVGNVLYTNKFSDANFSKKFQFDTNEGNSTRIKMFLSTKTSKVKKVFEINNVQKIIQDVVVTTVD